MSNKKAKTAKLDVKVDISKRDNLAVIEEISWEEWISWQPVCWSPILGEVCEVWHSRSSSGLVIYIDIL